METFIEAQRYRKKRSLKSDPIKREHICGCGKTYLSYPALYTHVKQKHNGTFPPGSTKQIKYSSRQFNKQISFKSKSAANFSKEFIAYLQYL